MAGTGACGIVRWLAATYMRWRRLYTGIRRAAAKQRPLPFCEMKATRRGTKASRGSERRHRDVDGRDGSKKKFCDPHNQAELAKCRLEAPLLDRYGSTAGATVDTGSLQQDLRLEAVRPRAAPPSLSLKAVKFRPQNKQKWPMRQTARRMAR